MPESYALVEEITRKEVNKMVLKKSQSVRWQVSLLQLAHVYYFVVTHKKNLWQKLDSQLFISSALYGEALTWTSGSTYKFADVWRKFSNFPRANNSCWWANIMNELGLRKSSSLYGGLLVLLAKRAAIIHCVQINP